MSSRHRNSSIMAAPSYMNSSGQMLEDVRLAVKGRVPVEFYARMGGVVPLPDEILHEIERITSTKLNMDVHPRDAWLERMTHA